MGGGGVMMDDYSVTDALRDRGQEAVRQPLVSVVIPTRNRSRLLQNAIHSVSRQTYANLEIIVVDDGSTDDTTTLMTAMTEPRIRYLRLNTPTGASAARNIGIRAAHGDVIGFLDDDDEWLPIKVERQLAVLKDYDAVLCGSDATRSRHGSSKNVLPLSPNHFRRSPFAVGGTGLLMARAVVVKDILFDEALPRCQDWDMFIRIANKYRVAYMNEPLLRYNRGPHDRISNGILNLPPAELEKRLCMLNKHRTFFGKYWYKNHLCGMLLYGIRHRERRIRHIMYVVGRCGIVATAATLGERLWDVFKDWLWSSAPKKMRRAT